MFSFLGFAIESLIYTNAWIFFYTAALELLRLLFVSKPDDSFLHPGAYPEPTEIPLYLILSALFVIFIIIFHKKIRIPLYKLHFLIKYLILFFLAFLFLTQLGSYPLQADIAPYTEPTDTRFTIAVFSLCLTFFITFLAEALLLETILKKHKTVRRTIFYLLVSILIIIITFPPRFPILGIDYSLFLGPIWEIIHGKTIFTDTTSLYGFISILFLSLLFKIRLLTFTNLPIFFWIMLVIEYFLCFYLVTKSSRSYLFGLISLLSIVAINYLTFRVDRTMLPQSGPLRWLPLIFSLFVFYKVKRIDSPILIGTITFFSLWMMDSGLALAAAYITSLIMIFFAGEIPWQKLLKTLGMFILTLTSLLIFINLLHLLFGYRLIDIFSLYNKLQLYARAGFGMVPIEAKNYFWLVILFYFTSIIYFFRSNLKSQAKNQLTINNQQLAILLFSANISLFASIYFVGRSHPSELFTISVIFLLNVFLLFSLIYTQVHSKKVKLIFALLLIIFTIIFPVWERKEAMAVLLREKINNLKKGDIFTPEHIDIVKKMYAKEIEMINKFLSNKKILAVTGDETYLLYLTNKQSLLKDNSLASIITIKDLERSIQPAIAECPKRIVTDCRILSKCNHPGYFSKEFYSWQPQIVKRVEKACGVSFSAKQCTDKLCIAESD